MTDETYTIGDSRAQTALAMAKSEALAMRGLLERRVIALRKKADDIEAFSEDGN